MIYLTGSYVTVMVKVKILWNKIDWNSMCDTRNHRICGTIGSDCKHFLIPNQNIFVGAVSVNRDIYYNVQQTKLFFMNDLKRIN